MTDKFEDALRKAGWKRHNPLNDGNYWWQSPGLTGAWQPAKRGKHVRGGERWELMRAIYEAGVRDGKSANER